MPRSRHKNSSAKNAAVTSTSTTPVSLLDSIRTQIESSIKPNNDAESPIDNSHVSASGWQCAINDWSDKKSSNNGSDTFPQTLRSITRKHEQGKNDFLPMIKTINNENTSVLVDQTKRTSTDNIDLFKLTSIVTDLIAGKRDQSAYTDFLLILQQFSVHSSRDDHLEETIYHLIQAAVSFIRANKHRFDSWQLEECYRQRYFLKTNSTE